jgi:hypothetical protein
MLTTLRRKSTALIALLALALAGLVLIPAGGSAADPVAPLWEIGLAVQEVPGEGTLAFDVAEDMSRFAFAEQPVHEDGMPAYGNPFITQGYIYPAGTLNGANGVNPDGSPEFPAKVLGEWTCRGWFVGDGAHSKTGPMVITTQLYSFGGAHGKNMLVSEGYELADVGVAIERAITGGTGEHVGARGEARQIFLGFNATEGVNLTVEIDLIAE